MPNTPRIAIGGILTECNHFGGIPVDMELYKATELVRGNDMLAMQNSVVGGMNEVLGRNQVDVRPLLFASACAAGPIVQSCYEELRDELLTRLKDELPVTGVLLPLHGAALADETLDPEGDIIERVRELVGPTVPIVVSVDLHAHITARMVRHADAILGWETYPHSDQYPTGQRAARLLLDVVAGNCQPTMAMGKVPVITSAIHGSTYDDDPFADLMRLTKSFESTRGVLTTSLFLIHPYMDVPGMGSGGLVVTDNDLELASSLATELGRQYWDRRHDLEPHVTPPAVAIQQGLALDDGPVILVETADCCGGGAAGDSIATLSALVDAGVNRTALVPLVDPEAAAACHAAGTGATLDLALGHKIDSAWGESRTFRGTVRSLSDGQFTYTGGQWEGSLTQMGPTAVFTIGSIELLIMSCPTYDWSDEQFRSVDLDPATAHFIVAKNPMNHRHAYGDIASRMILLDTPGPTPATVKHHRFQRMQRPFFPLDTDIPDFQPTLLT